MVENTICSKLIHLNSRRSRMICIKMYEQNTKVTQVPGSRWNTSLTT